MTLDELRLIRLALRDPYDEFKYKEAIRIIEREINLKLLDPTK